MHPPDGAAHAPPRKHDYDAEPSSAATTARAVRLSDFGMSNSHSDCG